MRQLKSILVKIVFIIILCSIIISSCAVPASYAKLDLAEGDFYYGGTTKGQYVPQEGIFSWVINVLGELVDWLLGISTMGIRMIVVGYTALIEHWLTNALEIASGIKANGDEVSTTDISTLKDSSNSVTVQGIVYNMIPALDINFFREESGTPYLREIKVTTGIDYDSNGLGKAKIEKKLAVVSPTGLALKCEKCKKPVRDCCSSLIPEEKKRGTDVHIPDNPCNSEGEDACTCKGNCKACKQYAALVEAKDAPVVILKTLIAVWYNIIRILSAAAMLILLIFIGIKSAFSSAASEKAQYKRVFADWVVGVILVFSIHYIMIFAVNINEILVETVRDSANIVNQVQLKQLSSDKKDSMKTDQEIEINVYDEIKTRAYDAKMTVGFSGMMMYVALVWFAIKYTIIYLKRYLTLAVLTLMGPAVGVSYALQKVLTGKGQSFKLWLTEYILNLIIQVVHALIYAVFISSALALSLKNVAGIIIALILMNFSLTAEKIFRRIFNLDASGKGLLSATENAGDPAQMQAKIKTLQGMVVGGKPAAKMLTALPTKAVKTIGAGAAAAAGAVLPKVGAAGKDLLDKRKRNKANKANKSSNSSSNSEELTDPVQLAESKLKDTVEQSSGSGRNNSKPKDTSGEAVLEGDKQPLDLVDSSDASEDTEVGSEDTKTTKTNENKVESENTNTEGQSESKEPNSAEQKSNNKIDENYVEKMVAQLTSMKGVIGQLSTADVLKAHLKETMDVNNFFDVSIDANGNEHYKLKQGLIFGRRYIDPETGKVVTDKSITAYNQIGDKLFRFTKEDKKLIKDVLKKSFGAVTGIPVAILGALIAVENPLMGFAMMSNVSRTLKFYNEAKPVSRFGRYSLKKFASPVLSAKYYSELAKKNRLKSEELLKANSSKTLKRHPDFVSKMKRNLCTPRTIGTLAAGTLGFVALGAIGGVAGGIATASVIKSINKANSVGYIPEDNEEEPVYKNKYNPYNLASPTKLFEGQNSSLLGKIEKHHHDQLKKQIAECEQEVFEDISKATAGQIHNKQKSILEKAFEDIEEKQQIEYWLRLGYIYDPKTKKFVKMKKDDDTDVKSKDLVKEVEVETTVGNTTEIKSRPLTQADIAIINKEIENVIVEISNGSQIDVNDEKTLDYITDALSSKLQKANIISSRQNVSALFKEKNTLKKAIKTKSEVVNREIEKATKTELELSNKETTVISEAIDSAVNEELINALSSSTEIKPENIDEEKIYNSIAEKLQPKQKNEPKEKSESESSIDSKKEKNKKSEKSKVKQEEASTSKISPEKEQIYRQAIHIMLENKTEQVNQINVEKPQNIQVKRESRPQSENRRIKDTITQLAKKNIEMKHEPTQEQKEEVTTEVKKASKKAIKQKLDQIKKIDFDSLDSKIDESRTEKDDLTLQLLLVKKELAQKAEAINIAAEETLGRKVKRKTKTNALTLEAIRKKSEETAEYNKLKKKKVNYELRNRIVTDIDITHLDEKKQKEYEALKANIDAQKAKVVEAEAKVERRQKENGPITDANKTFTRGLDDFLKKYND